MLLIYNHPNHFINLHIQINLYMQITLLIYI